MNYQPQIWILAAAVCVNLPNGATAAVVVDNDAGVPAYVETGTWSTSGSAGYDGGTYRWAVPGSIATATWTANLPEAGDHELFVWYVPGSNRATARYDVLASDGTHAVYVDQTLGGYSWESLGTFNFIAGDNTITLNVGGSTGGSAVIADAVRFGDDGGGPPDPPDPVEIAPGVFHSMWELSDPQVVHVVEFDLADPQYTIEMGFAHEQRNYSGKEVTSQIAARYDGIGHDVIAAVNASHFDAGIFIHGAHANNSNVVGYPTLTWPKEGYVLQESGVGFVVSNMPAADPVVRYADGTESRVDVYNYTCTTNTLALYTVDWGASTGTTNPGVEVIVEGVNYPIRANKWVRGVIAEIRTGTAALDNDIPSDGFVLSACPGAENDVLAHAVAGEAIEFCVGLLPAKVNNAKVLCGGCSGWLVRDGVAFPENWTYSHAPVRHPRTALAWSGTRHWFVTFDGRQPGYSVGRTYTEMADFLVNHLGVDQAVNLDGGGSTTMLINGSVANCPSDGADPPCTGVERAVPNALLLVQRDATSSFPMDDDFTSGERILPWDEKFTFSPIISFTPSGAPSGNALRLLKPDGGHETMSLGDCGDADYSVEATIYCSYRPGVSPNGFERYGVYARDDGNAHFDGDAQGGGNCYALTYDSNDGRVRAGIVVDGVYTDFLDGARVYEPSSGWRMMRIECNDTKIRYFLDDILLIEIADATHTDGRFGIGYQEHFADDSNALGAHIASFSASAIFTGDYDGDGDVDLTDFSAFRFCLAGPDFEFPAGHFCHWADSDDDNDVDLSDFGSFQTVFTGP